MPGRRKVKMPTSRRQARFYYWRASQGDAWAKEKVGRIHKAGKGSIKRLRPSAKRGKSTKRKRGKRR